MTPYNNWDTAAEISFINGLGNWKGDLVDKLPLLRSYLDGLQLRVRWENIHRSEVEAHVRKRIQEIVEERHNRRNPKEDIL